MSYGCLTERFWSVGVRMGKLAPKCDSPSTHCSGDARGGGDQLDGAPLTALT